MPDSLEAKLRKDIAHYMNGLQLASDAHYQNGLEQVSAVSTYRGSLSDAEKKTFDKIIIADFIDSGNLAKVKFSLYLMLKSQSPTLFDYVSARVVEQ